MLCAPRTSWFILLHIWALTRLLSLPNLGQSAGFWGAVQLSALCALFHAPAGLAVPRHTSASKAPGHLCGSVTWASHW